MISRSLVYLFLGQWFIGVRINIPRCYGPTNPQFYCVYQKSYGSCRKSYWLIQTVFSSANRWSYSVIGLDQCVASSACCRTINTIVKSSVSLVLLYVGPLIRQSRPVCHKSYLIQNYRYTSQDQCIESPIESPNFCRTINILVETSVSLF